MFTIEDIGEWVGPTAFKRGQAYFRDGRVKVRAIDDFGDGDFFVDAHVKGSRRAPYHTEFAFEHGMLVATCTCPVGYDCKHGAAVALAFLASRPPVAAPSVVAPPAPLPLPSAKILPFRAPGSPGVAADWREALVEEAQPAAGPRAWSYVPLLQLAAGKGRRPGPALGVKLARLQHGRLSPVSWHVALKLHSLATPEGLLIQLLYRALVAQGFAAQLRPAQREPTWLPIPPELLGDVLGLLALAPQVRFEDGRAASVHPQEPLEGGYAMARDEAGITLVPVLRTARGTVEASEVVRLGGEPLDWALVAGRHFHPVGAPPAGQVIAVPSDEVKAFEREFLPTLAVEGRLSGPDAPRSTEVVQGQPTPLLIFEEAHPGDGDEDDEDEDDRDPEALLTARVGFRYGSERVDLFEDLKLLGPPEGPFMARDEAAEDALLHFAADQGYNGFYVTGAVGFDEGEAIAFVKRTLPVLVKAGWEVIGEDIAHQYRLASGRARSSLKITSGIDWFDVHAAVTVGQETVPWASLLRALYSGKQYVKLGSGAYAELPEKWLKKQVGLLSLLRGKPGKRGQAEAAEAAELEGGLRVARHQAPLLAAMAEAADVAALDAGFQAFSDKLRSFGGIAEVPVPAGFVGELRPYQARGLSYLAFLREYGLHGILADDMGLGKTVQAAALLQANHAGRQGPPSLVVAPTSLLENWRAELARFAPGLRVLILHGPDRDHAAIDAHDVVITTYTTARLDAARHKQRTYDTLILDEAQAIKNPQAQTTAALCGFKAAHRLCLTGTPIENNLGELWSLFQFLMPGLLASEKAFRERYALPISAGNKEAKTELKARVAPFILRRLKADVAPELPPRTDMVVWCELLPAQRRVYDTVLAASRATVEAALEDRGLERSRIAILAALLKLRQACCHPALLKTPETLEMASGKLEAFLELVDELVEGGHRALVFSQFTSMLALLKPALAARGVAFEYLDGQTRDRGARVKRFNEGEASLFLISLKAGGTGLNLTGADYVIHFDPWWNPAVEDQATDRAHRIGQTRHVFNYKLIAKGTIEEKLLTLQDQKRGLVRDLLDAEGAGKQLTKADLQFLFADAAPRRRAVY